MKDDYYNNVFKKNRQRAKVLIAREDFQEDIRSIREKFRIPQRGFANDKENRDWHIRHLREDDKYFDTTWLSNRKKFQRLKKEKKNREAEKLNKKLNDEAPVNSFRIATKNLLKKYKVPLSWEYSIQRYIFFDDINLIWLPGGVSIKGERDKDTGLDKLWIGIEADTTLADIKNAWKSVMFHQKRLNSYIQKKFQPMKNFERDKRAYELRKSGKSYKKIANVLSKEYKTVYSYDDVPTFIKRHKQKTGNN